MPVAKLIPILIGGVLLLAVGVFYFVPSVRPAVVNNWFNQAKGFGPATSAEDALDKFKRAIEKRDYDAAKQYLTGDYAEFFSKGMNDARELVTAIDELTAAMKTTGVKSDKVDLWLFWLDPLPPFKYEVKNKDTGTVTALVHWNEDAARLRGVTTETYRVNPLLMHSLLPTGTAIPVAMTVYLKKAGEGWKLELPIRSGDRHLRDCVETLRKNATNYRNAIQDIKNSIKNNPAVKEDFEREFKTNLEKAN